MINNEDPEEEKERLRLEKVERNKQKKLQREYEHAQFVNDQRMKEYMERQKKLKKHLAEEDAGIMQSKLKQLTVEKLKKGKYQLSFF